MSDFTQLQIEEIVNILVDLDPMETKIYLGCDSVRIRKGNANWARYATVCIIHCNARRVCRIFNTIDTERDFDLKKNRPKIRMLNEVQKVCGLYVQLTPFIDEFDVEIHLDISTDPKNGSNCAATEAAGYVLGMTGVEPKLKPDSFASSFGADHIANGKNVLRA